MTAGTSQSEAPADLLVQSFESASDGVILLDRQWRYLYVNPAARAMLPLPIVIGQCIWSDPVSLAASTEMRQRWERALLSGASSEFEEYSPLMKQWLQVRACPVAAGLLLMLRPIDRYAHQDDLVSDTLSRFWSMFENLPEAVVVADPQGQILGANRATLAMFGIDDNTRLRRNITEFNDIEIADESGRVLTQAQWPMSRTLLGESFADYRVEFRRLDTGFRLWGSCAGTPVRNAAGQIVLAIVTVRDITRQREAEHRLAASEAFYRTLDEFLPHLLWTLDAEGNYQHANRRWREFTGMAPEGVNNESINQIVHPDDVALRTETLRRCMETGGLCEAELRYRRVDGEYRWMLARWGPVRDRDGNITQWMGTATDIHDWKINGEALRRTLESLRASELRFQTFMDHSPAWAWINDAEGNILYMNRVQRETLGLRHEPTRSLKLWDIFPQEQADLFHHQNLHVIRSGEELQDIAQLDKYGDGTLLIFRFPLESEGRTVAGGLAIDISEQHRIQAELVRAKEAAESANRAKDQFLAILSHELRTPLTPVLLFSSALEKNPALPEEVRADLALIRQQVQLEARLIDDLLDLTRIQRGKFLLNLGEVQVHDVLRRVVALAGSQAIENGLHLSLDLVAEDDLIWGDASRLQQLFGNLVGNAIKFTPAGGAIVVHTHNLNDQIIIEVSDTGIGIPPEAQGAVFNAFEQAEQSITRRYGGLGLGLTIGKAITEHHGGAIEVQSNGSIQGTTLRVCLPLHDGVPAPPEPPADEPPETRQRVLLVEDHEATREILQRLLQQAGFDVLPADSVAAAVHIGTRQPFDLLLCDIGLPDGSGVDVVTRLKGIASFRAIALSGYGSDDDIARSLEAGFEQHLVKPVDYHKLRTVLAETGTAQG